MKWLNKHPLITLLIVFIACYSAYLIKSSKLEFNQTDWKNAYSKNNTSLMYRMSKSLCNKINNGIIKNTNDASNILGLKNVTMNTRISLNKPILPYPYYLSLSFNKSGQLISHGVYPD